MRLTAEGRVRPCLFSDTEWDLKPLLRRGAPDEEIERFIIDAMWTKQAGHGIGTDGFVQPQRGMSAIGG
jgi:cyclic pyranopterin phosphate synthase